ncbi:MAG: response regulator [Bacteroidetes bacterium]|nr:response regulator [Bacteroidota bacterium]
MEQIIRILYVEDNEYDARNFQRELEKSSLTTSLLTVNTIVEAMSYAEKQDFDIVFLDYHLPGENGLSLLRTIRNRGFSVPVVIITNYADPQVAVEMMQSGASDYIPKSLLNTDGIEQCIRNSIRYSELEQVRKSVELSLKSAEEKLSTIISYTPVILFSVNPNGELTFAKGRNLGSIMPGGDELVGESVYEIFEDHDEFIGQIKIALAGNEVTQSIKFGNTVYQISCTPRMSAKGKVEEVVGIAYDVTKRAEAEESLLKAKLLAEQTSKAKQDFIANMSHEIRTPMNAIIGFTNLLEETTLDEVQKDYVKTIQMSGENLLDLINDILDFSKIEAGKLFIEKEEFVLRDTISSVERVLKGKADEKRIKLIINVDPEVPQHLLGDSNRLYQVLMNLVSNAVKFTDKGKVTVEVNKMSQRDGKVKLKFIVADTGIGIHKDNYESIFESFSQISSGTTRKYGGTGLGLAIVKRLIELQQGRIKVSSKLKEGSTFEFELQYALGKNKDSEMEQVFVETLDLSVFKGKKVLLAEDNRMNQKLIENVLGNLGIDLKVVNNGKEVVDLLQNEVVDILLLDIQMPVMDGFEVANYIRNNIQGPKRNIPIIAMTAHAFKEERDACLKAGMNDHIAKPIQKEELLRIMHHLIVQNAENMEQPMVDISYLKSLSEGNDEFVTEMLTIFSEDTPVLMQQMKVAVDNEDWKKTSQLAHKYRSPLALLGIKPIEEIMNKIEYSAKEKSNLSEIKVLFKEADILTLSALEYINQQLVK